MELRWMLRACVQRGFPGGETPLRQVELHDRLAERHVLENLVHGGFVIHFISAIGIHAHVRRAHDLPQRGIRNTAGELDTVLDRKLTSQLAHGRKLRAVADDDKLHVVAVERLAHVRHGLEEQIQSPACRSPPRSRPDASCRGAARGAAAARARA
jgi:hypothetical protein